MQIVSRFLSYQFKDQEQTYTFAYHIKRRAPAQRKARHDDRNGQRHNVVYMVAPLEQEVSQKEFNQLKKDLVKYDSPEDCWFSVMKEVVDKQSQFNINVIEYIL